MGRRGALDGLRALAVLAVVASHTFVRAEGGFLGVDIFFVLSGYLITSLLLNEWDRNGRIDFAAFYRRRVARLAPAYLLMLVLVVPLMLGPLRAETAWPVPLAAGVTLIYGANWANVVNPDALGPIRHTWSLSIEEQFYLLWPAVFVGLTRRRRSVAGWLAAASGVIVALRVIGWSATRTVWPYFATITHGDGLLIGCVTAVLLHRARNRSATDGGSWTAVVRRADLPVAWAAAAVLGLLMAIARVDSGWTYLLVLLLAAVCTALVVRHLAVADDGPMVRLLSWAPLVAIGRVSYGLYLFHVPAFHLVGSLHLGYLATIALEYSLAAGLTTVSWYLVEQPAQRWVRRRWPREHISLDHPAPRVPPVEVATGSSRLPRSSPA